MLPSSGQSKPQIIRGIKPAKRYPFEAARGTKNLRYDALVAGVDFSHMGAGWQHGDDSVALVSHLGWAAHGDSPVLGQLLRGLREDVVHHQAVSFRNEVLGHVLAHVPQPNEPNRNLRNAPSCWRYECEESSEVPFRNSHTLCNTVSTNANSVAFLHFALKGY